jgi:hypothetical protein
MHRLSVHAGLRRLARRVRKLPSVLDQGFRHAAEWGAPDEEVVSETFRGLTEYPPSALRAAASERRRATISPRPDRLPLTSNQAVKENPGAGPGGFTKEPISSRVFLPRFTKWCNTRRYPPSGSCFVPVSKLSVAVTAPVAVCLVGL